MKNRHFFPILIVILVTGYYSHSTENPLEKVPDYHASEYEEESGKILEVINEESSLIH